MVGVEDDGESGVASEVGVESVGRLDWEEETDVGEVTGVGTSYF